MTAGLTVFIASLLLLEALDRATRMRKVLLGLNSTFVKVNLSLFAALAVMTERVLAGEPRELLLSGFVGIAVLDICWAAWLAGRGS
jgi:hypothetical protein